MTVREQSEEYYGRMKNLFRSVVREYAPKKTATIIIDLFQRQKTFRLNLK